jgi:hypothetical protein
MKSHLLDARLFAVERSTRRRKKKSLLGGLGRTLSMVALSAMPWWLISLALHGLSIALLMLLTFTVYQIPDPDVVVVTTTLAQEPLVRTVSESSRLETTHVLVPQGDLLPDGSKIEATTMVAPPEIRQNAELSDHFETSNPDRPDVQSVFGTLEAKTLQDESGSDVAEGGGIGGAVLDDLIGVGSYGSPGTGGGWGGGNGLGIGTGDGSKLGSFGQRGSAGRRMLVARHGGSHETENSVDRALAWLAKHQEPDGHWSATKHEAGFKTDTACTGLAVLAFLGAGHTERVGQYKDNVRRAVVWMKSKQNDAGLVYDTTDAAGNKGVGYPHAICGMAMAEAAGMAHVPDTVDAAQRAIDYTVNDHQCGEGVDKRGFRYNPKQEADISVTGWFVMQLKSAKTAGLRVDYSAFAGADRFLDTVEHKGEGGNTAYGPASVFYYQPGRHTQHRTCSIGTLCRQFLGEKQEVLRPSVEYFVKQGGVPSNWGNGTDLYYWYYGTMCAFQQGGEVWHRWNDAMKKTLCDSQRKGGDTDGSWDVVGAYSGDWGRVGQTALACLCLEVYYRYLPMYR